MVIVKIVIVLFFICKSLSVILDTDNMTTTAATTEVKTPHTQNITAIPDAKYHVSIGLIFTDAVGRSIRCGGCIINPSTVLTAAHCLFFKMSTAAAPDTKTAGISVQVTLPLPSVLFAVTAGTTKQRHLRGDGSIEFGIVAYTYHESFDFATSDNDIALLRLDGEIPKNNPNIVVTPLANSTPSIGDKCYMYGYDSGNELLNISAQLLRIPVKIHDISKCYGQSPRTSICAGDENAKSGSCRGDIGSPLICNNALAGIKAPTKCEERPGLFMDVHKYSKWIEGNEHFTPRQYAPSRALKLYKNVAFYKHFLYIFCFVILSTRNNYFSSD